MSKINYNKEKQNGGIIFHLGKNIVLSLMSVLGRRITGRNSWLDKLNSIDNPDRKIRYVQRECEKQSERTQDFGAFLNTAIVHSHKWLGDGLDKNFVSSCLARLPIEQVAESSVRRAERSGIPLRASFRISLTLRSKKREFGDLSEWRLNKKQIGSLFARSLGIRVPASIQTNVPFSEIVFKKNTVIKPASGAASNGVYIINENNEIICVKGAKKILGWSQLKSHIEEIMRMDLIQNNQWLVEELIIGHDGQIPPADIKCYTFYGQTERVLYIERYPCLVNGWFDRNGHPVNDTVLKKSKPNLRIVEAVALADDIGIKIPAPFIRIDMLDGKDGLVFGEFTPRPGTYSNLDANADYRFGMAFLGAEERLITDLLKGKRFPEYVSQFDIGGALGHKSANDR